MECGLLPRAGSPLPSLLEHLLWAHCYVVMLHQGKHLRMRRNVWVWPRAVAPLPSSAAVITTLLQWLVPSSELRISLRWLLFFLAILGCVGLSVCPDSSYDTCFGGCFLCQGSWREILVVKTEGRRQIICANVIPKEDPMTTDLVVEFSLLLAVSNSPNRGGLQFWRRGPEVKDPVWHSVYKFSTHHSFS